MHKFKCYIMLIGLPGAGKSTYIRENMHKLREILLQNRQTVLTGRISTDAHVEHYANKWDISYNEAFDQLQPYLSELVNADIQDILHESESTNAGVLVFDDRTNLTFDIRQARLDQFKNFTRIGVVFNADPVLCWSRCVNRTDKVIPDYVFRRFVASFEAPTSLDAFDSVWYT